MNIAEDPSPLKVYQDDHRFRLIQDREKQETRGAVMQRRHEVSVSAQGSLLEGARWDR